MRLIVVAFAVLIGVSAGQADGLSPMPLERVVPMADVILLVNVSENDVTIEESKPRKGHASVTYTCKIKADVVKSLKGSAPKQLDITFTFQVVKGVWVSWPGSGLEERMKPGEEYVFLMRSRDDKLQLLRAEQAEQLKTIEALLKEANPRPDAPK